MNYKIDIEQEEDGRYIAEIVELPGVLVYGNSQQEAIAKVQALALGVLADQLEQGELPDNHLQFIICCSMSQWSATKAKQVLKALKSIGWKIKRSGLFQLK